MLTELLDIQRRKPGDDHPDTLKTADNLAVNFLSSSGIETWRSCSQTSSFRGARTQSIPGIATTRPAFSEPRCQLRKSSDEAEKLLLDGYKGLSDRQAATDLNALEQSRQRIIQLYQSWGKPERAEEWRTRLAVAR